MRPRTKNAQPPRKRQAVDMNYDIVHFASKQDELDWRRYRNRKILTGRRVEMDPANREQMLGLLTPLNWTDIVDLPEVVYPDLVRYFYCNLHAYNGPLNDPDCDISEEEDESEFKLSSHVNGVELILTPTRMANALNLPRGTDIVHFTKDSDLPTFADPNDVYTAICKHRTVGGGIVQSELKPSLRLFHKYIIANILPKGGHRDAVSPLECYILYCALSDIQLDLANILLHEMYEVERIRGRALPYGALLTSVFTAYGVRLTGEQSTILTGPFTNYVVTRGLKIVESDEEEEEEEEEEEGVGLSTEPMDIGGPSSEPVPEQAAFTTAPPAYLQDILRSVEQMSLTQQQLLTQQMAYQAQLTTFQNQTHTRLDRLESRMDHLFTYYTLQHPDFPHYQPPSPPQPFPPPSDPPQ